MYARCLMLSAWLHDMEVRKLCCHSVRDGGLKLVCINWHKFFSNLGCLALECLSVYVQSRINSFSSLGCRLTTGYIKNLWQVISPEKWSLDLFIHIIDEHSTCFNAFLIQHWINLDFPLDGTLYWPALKHSKDQLYEMMKGYKIFKRK